jgi:hypothetical protein
MTWERYKATIEVVDDLGRAYEILHFVTILDGREGSSFYRLPNGTPAHLINADDFEIGLIEKVRAKRR